MYFSRKTCIIPSRSLHNLCNARIFISLLRLVRCSSFEKSEVNKNETTDRLPAYVDDIKDDAFTLRLQYKF